MTNYERWASTPEKVADLLIQFNPSVRAHRPAVKSYQRFVNDSLSNGCMRLNERDRLTEWLQEECND